MNPYSTVVFVHVITAILGLGPLTVLAVNSSGPAAHLLSRERTTQLMRLIGWSLAAMFLTGAAIIAFTHGALGETGWMRVSFALFVVLGALHGLARRELRKARQSSGPATFGKPLSLIVWTMCAVVTAITYLMEAKPW